MEQDRTAAPRGLAFAVFVLVSLIHAMCPVTTASDSRWTVHLALSIMHRGDADLDEYLPELRENDFYAVNRVNGSYYSSYPPGGPVISIPIILVLEQAVAVAGAEAAGYAKSQPLLHAFLSAISPGRMR